MLEEVIEDYQIIEHLGSGATGDVFKAKHLDWEDNYVAVKLLHTRHSDDKRRAKRFLTEARAAAKVHHPSVVRVQKAGLHEGTGRSYIIMEYLAGESLADYLQSRKTVPEIQAIRFALQIMRALHAAHRKGIVHRDVKPANLYVTADPAVEGHERIKVLDFSIAKLVEGSDATTEDGTQLGTPAYMSPEQCRGTEELDERSDFYSLGVVLFEILTGLRPFQSKTRDGYYYAHVNEPAPSLLERNPNISPSTAAIVERLLAKDPRKRFNPRDLEDALVGTLETLQDRRAAPVPQRSLIATMGLLATLALVAAGVGAYVWISGPPTPSRDLDAARNAPLPDATMSELELLTLRCNRRSGQDCGTLAIYYEGLQDQTKSLQLHRQACQYGYGRSCFVLGERHADANKDADAAQRFDEACFADLPDANGCMRAALLYEGKFAPAPQRGTYRERYARAAQLFEPQCDAGTAQACSDLSYLYDKLGDTAKGDEKESKAREYFERDCFQRKDGEACYRAGDYFESAGDTGQALKLFHQGCRLDHDGSCAKLKPPDD